MVPSPRQLSRAPSLIDTQRADDVGRVLTLPSVERIEHAREGHLRRERSGCPTAGKASEKLVKAALAALEKIAP